MCQDEREQRAKRPQRGVAHRAGRDAVDRKQEDAGRARCWARRGEAAVQAGRVWQAVGLTAPVLAAKREPPGGLLPVSRQVALPEQRALPEEPVSARRAARRRALQKQQPAERAGAAAQQPEQLERPAREALRQAALQLESRQG